MSPTETYCRQQDIADKTRYDREAHKRLIANLEMAIWALAALSCSGAFFWIVLPAFLEMVTR